LPAFRKLADSPRLLGLRRTLRRLPPTAALLERADRRRLEDLQRAGDLHARAQSRWRAALPSAGLTWGRDIDGTAFVACASAHGAFGPGRRLLEIGPGYGRILDAVLEGGYPFAGYTGLDLSAANVAHLRARFADPRVEFVHADAEQTSLSGRFDTVLSSLTFKHAFPSFAAILANLAAQLDQNAVVAFDLIEGERRYFQRDERTYIREYSRGEIPDILRDAGFELTAFDHVEHARRFTRLLVVARPRSGAMSGEH
jgi:SAM-dependent methyltransferase